MLVLVLVILSGFLVVVLLALGGAILARHRVAAAADLAALAAASGPGISGGPGGSGGCSRAGRVATANGVRLSACRGLADGSVVVTVESSDGGSPLLGTARARARAAPGAARPLDFR